MVLKNKRGQSALEYLMTYGWALIVIVVVIAALVFLINPQQVGTEGCTGFARLPIGNFRFATTGLTMNITNETGRNLTNLNFDGAFTNAGTRTQFPADTNVSLTANSTLTKTISTTLVAGSVTADMNVTYNDGDFTRVVTASCKGTA